MFAVRTARCCGSLTLLVLAALAPPATSAQPAAPPRPASPSPAGEAPGLVLGGAMDLRWTAPLDVAPGSTPVANDDTAYVVTRAPAAVAVDLASGATRWQVDAATSVTPARGAELAFVVVADGVRAVRGATGAAVWHRPLSHAVVAPPGVGADRLVVSLANGDALALGRDDGGVLWQASLGTAARLAPVTAEDRWYFALADRRIVAIDAGSGDTVWTRGLDTAATGLLPLAREVLVATTGGVLLSLDGETGRPRWRWRLGTPVAGSPAADARHVYVVGFDHLLRALDRRSANLRWRQALPHRPASGPVLAGDAVLVPSLSTEIPIFSAATGAPGSAITSSSEVGSALHFLAGARPTSPRLLAVTTDGTLLAFTSRIEPVPAPIADLPGLTVPEPPPAQAAPPPPPVAPPRR